MTDVLNQSPDALKGVSLGLPAVETPPQPLTFLVHWLELSIWPTTWPITGSVKDLIPRVMYAVNSCLFGHDQQDAESLWQRFDWGGHATLAGKAMKTSNLKKNARGKLLLHKKPLFCVSPPS